MENQSILNPDGRPLPDGWVQHYEPAKQIWYYVEIAMTPPTVSFVHPADLISTNRARSPAVTSPTMAIPQFPNPTMRRSPNGYASSVRPQGMTIAQKLYASSGNRAATAPMINSNNISNLSTSVDAASSPTSPPASSRGSVLLSPTSTSPSGSESSRPISYLPPSRHSVQSRMNYPRTTLYGPTLESSISLSNPSQNRADHNLHRAATAPAFPMPTTTMNIPERLHSQSVAPSAPNSYSTISRAPHIVTTARPPALDSPSNGQSMFPPPASLLFAAPPEKTSPSSYGSGYSTVSLHDVQKYNYLGLSQHTNQLGTASTNPGGLDAASLLAMLKTALSMNPISESELRAVAYAELNAKYQVVLNALKHQQRYRPNRIIQTHPTSGMGAQHRPSVDYQELITEVGRLEIKATLAQQSLEQAQVAQQQQIALDTLQKQQEAALAQRQQKQQQLILNQQAQEQALLQQQQNVALAQHQALMNQQAQAQAMQVQQQQVALAQQAQEQAVLKLQLQQQQQAAFAQQAQEQAMVKLQLQQQQQVALDQQQTTIKQQADEQAALKLQLQQQQILAQQQALMQANQQQLHTLQQQQAAQQQLLAQQSASVNHHQGGQQQQQGNSAIPQQLVSHLVHSVVGSFQHQGSGGSDPSASSATSNNDTGNFGLMDPLTQSLNNFNSGNNGGQDPSSGLFGGFGNVDFGNMFSGNNVDFSSLTSNVDFSSGMDFDSNDY